MRLLRWIAERGVRVTLVIALAFVVYHVTNELRALSGGPLNFHQRLELTALDVKFAFRGRRPPDRWQVAIAALDERAIAEFGPPPWSRTVHAELIDRLTELEVGSVAFDMTFDQATTSPRAESARALGAQLDPVLAKTEASIEQGSAKIERVAERLSKVRRPPEVKRSAQELETVADDVRESAAGLRQIRSELTQAAAGQDPDRAFAEAIRRSGRVVLGMVAYSDREAISLAREKGESAAQLRLVSSSTISEIVSPGAGGLAQIHDGKEMFEHGLFRTYFGVQAPAPILAHATPHFALINAAQDVDGANRRLPLVSAIAGTGVLLPSLALKAVAVTRAPDPIEVLASPGDLAPRGIRVGDLQVDVELGATSTLDWYGRFDGGDIPIWSIADLIQKKIPAEEVKGRVVFVAATAIGTHDQRVTPLESAVPGVYIHATMAQNLLDGRHLTRPLYAVALEVALMLLIGLLAGLVMTRFAVIGQMLTAFVLAAGWVLLDQLVLFEQGLVVYAVLPIFQIFTTLLAVAIWSFVVEQRERRRTKAAFGRYLAPRVMEQVLSNPEQFLRLGGRRYEATVLFSDIRGFTTISEALTPEDLGLLLNQYMTPMTDIVFAYEGTLDKYIGDAVMAFWGAPVEQDNHARLACRAALEMLKKVAELNRRFEQEGLPRIAIGIGLSSGPMTIGNMGSDDHFSYTALGDRVNLGARLEGQTKEYGVDTMISDATHELVKDEMLCRELGSLRVKGKLEPVRIYELIGAKTEHQHRVAFVDKFHEGLALFRDRQWDDAAGCFNTARALSGVEGDRCSDLYITWCMEYKKAPPPEGWDGVRIATSK